MINLSDQPLVIISIRRGCLTQEAASLKIQKEECFARVYILE